MPQKWNINNMAQLAAYREFIRDMAGETGTPYGDAALALLKKYREEPPSKIKQNLDSVLWSLVHDSENARALLQKYDAEQISLYNALSGASEDSPADFRMARDLVWQLINAAIQLAEILDIPATIFDPGGPQGQDSAYYSIAKVTSSSPNSAPVIELGEVSSC